MRYKSTHLLIILFFLHHIFYCQTQTTYTTQETSWCQTSADCRQNGICNDDGKSCSCSTIYGGVNCAECAVGYYNYPICYTCSWCEQNNGICDHVTDTCICSDPNRFQGMFCEACQDHHYGTNCSNAPIILQIIPTTIKDTDARDGIDIAINGDNFNYTSIAAVICRFEGSFNVSVQAFQANSTTIVCRLSNYTGDPTINVFISLDNGDTWIDKQFWYSNLILINRDCGGKNCYAGSCAYGNCACYVGYIGTLCDQCDEGYFRTPDGYCVKCSDHCLNNGTCTNQTCICREGFTDYRCDTCAEHYYGLNCLKQSIILNVYPTSIIDIEARDGIDIIINGDNFDVSDISKVICRFEGTKILNVQATYANYTSIICHMSNYSSISFTNLLISLNGGENWFERMDNVGSRITITSLCTDMNCNHGHCSYGSCLCDEGYSGITCNNCADGFFRDPNQLCLNCSQDCRNNGVCINETCRCSKNFAAPFCEECATNFFGPMCLSLPKIDHTLPDIVNDIGGFNISVFGVNFNPQSTEEMTYCKYSSYTNGYTEYFTRAIVFNDSMLTCSVPAYALHSSKLWYLKIVINETVESYTVFSLQVRGICQNSTICEQHGYCRFGQCICTAPYYGSSCEIIMSPLISNPLPLIILNEFSSTSINLTTYITSGTPPFRYKFSNIGDLQSFTFYYKCLALNEESGSLNITRAIASPQNYNFTITVSNSWSSVDLILLIQVAPSYNATVFWKNSRQYLPAGTIRSLEFFGDSSIPKVPIAIWINNVFYQQIESDDEGHFSGYYTLSFDSFEGKLYIAASHPDQNPESSSHDVIYIGSLRVSLSQWTYAVYTGYQTNFTDFVTIENRGDFDFTNLNFNLIYNSPCIQNYYMWPSFIQNLSTSSTINVSLSISSNCSFSYESMSFSINQSSLSSLASTSFIITSQWSCRTKNQCNGHGSCINNETCLCTNFYSGDSCQQCASNRFQYPYCTTCPECIRGQAICNGSIAMCDCIDNTRIYGSLCEYCHQGYYGENCLNIPIISSLLPISGLETANNTIVTLIGDNFQNISSFCLITDKTETKSIPATFISSTQISCIFPVHIAEVVSVQLLLDGSIVYSKNSLVYQYLPSCPQTGCNQGVCTLGSCRCMYPYFGGSCSLLPIPPVLTTIPNFILTEMSSFVLNLAQYLIQGDAPLEWYLSGTINTDLSIDTSTGLLSWPFIIPSSTVYNISVNALQSSTGVSSRQNFNIYIDLEYNVTVKFDKSHQILSKQATIQINGLILNKTVSLRNRTVKVWIMINNIRRYLPTINVNGLSNRFTTYYTPLSNEYGTLFVGAEHPAEQSKSEPQDYLTLLGLNVQILNFGTLNAKAGENFTNIFSSIALLSNPSEFPIMNLTSSLIGPLGVVTFFDLSSSNCSLTNISPLTTCVIDLNIQFVLSGSGTFTFQWIAQGISPVTFSIPISIVYSQSEFKLSSSSARFIIPRKSQETLVINVYNTGFGSIGPLTVLLPNQTYVSVLTPDISTLMESTYSNFTLGIVIPEFAPLTTISIRGLVTDRSRSLSQSFNIEFSIVGSDDTLFDLNIVCKDEYSYLGSNTVNLANVTITISNTQLNVRHVLKSNETGQANVALVAGIYEISAGALKHSNFRDIITIDRATASSGPLILFLQRIFVSYIFKVSKIAIEGTYSIAVDAQFVTYVPAPVIVMSPAVINLDELEADESITQIDFTFTNYGLIRVTSVQFYLPTEHPYLRFYIQQLPIGDIEGNSTIIVAVTVSRNYTTRTRRDSITSMIGKYSASYICGILRKIEAYLPRFVRNITYPDLSSSGSIGGGSWGALGGFSDGGTGITVGTADIKLIPVTCESAVQYLFDKGGDMLKGLPGLGNSCGGLAISLILGTATLSDAGDCVSAVISLGGKSSSRHLRHITETKNSHTNSNGLITTFESAMRRKRSTWDENADASVVRLNYMIEAVTNYEELITLTYGNKIWTHLNCTDDSWENTFFRAQQRTSDLESLISEQEYNELMIIHNRCVDRNLTSEYILYRNRTIYYSSQNITESNTISDTSLPYMSLSAYENRSSQYQKDLDYSHLLGYPNIIDAYKGVYQQFLNAYEDSPIGVCAKVTIRILQNVAITRQGFDAELIIDNSGTDILYDIQITLEIQTENQTNATDRFSIGAATIIGDIDNQNLPSEGTGQFNWLIIPYQSAAPIVSTWYNVGGQLSYTVDGQRVKITLLPDRIQVDPEARLDIAYFLEQQVIGSDPFSSQWIPPQPFILAVIITNNGYGSVNNFRITSGQPEIIENEKGLVINFTITGMNINGEQRTDLGLSASLGEIKPFSSSIITWDMIASLKGYFKRFNASYTEINPNGDTKLSLINSLTTNRLQHVVSLDILFPNLSDNRIDYLVNEPDGMETVHTSTNATISFPVVIVQGTAQYFLISETTHRLIVTANVPNSSFIHITINNSYPENIITSSKRISDNFNVTINTWLTHYVDHLIIAGDRIEDLLHIFDWSSSSDVAYEIILQTTATTENPSPQSTSTTNLPELSTTTLVLTTTLVEYASNITTEASSSTTIDETTLSTTIVSTIPNFTSSSNVTTNTNIDITDTTSVLTTILTTDETTDTTTILPTREITDTTTILPTSETTDTTITVTTGETIHTTSRATNTPSVEITTLESTTDSRTFSSPIIHSTTQLSTDTSTTTIDLRTTTSTTTEATTQFTTKITTVSTDRITDPITTTNPENNLSTTSGTTSQSTTHENTIITTTLTSTTTDTYTTTDSERISTITMPTEIVTTSTTITSSTEVITTTMMLTNTASLSSTSIVPLSSTTFTSSIAASSTTSTDSIKSSETMTSTISSTKALLTSTALISETTYTAPLRLDSYIEFMLMMILKGEMSLIDLIKELQLIFIYALQIPSNQIQMSPTPLTRINKRSTTEYEVYVRLYSTESETATSLLTRIQQQLADENSEIRKNNLTSDLNPNSIKNLKTWYICIGETVQETRCIQIITLIPHCEGSMISTKLNFKRSQGFLLAPIQSLFIIEFLFIYYFRLYWT